MMADLLFNQPTSPNTKLDKTQEMMFMKWYQDIASKVGLNSNPDDPNHFYDYRAAWQAGVKPDPKNLHWPSQFKFDNHPNRFVPFKGMLLDTKYDRLVNPNLLSPKGQ